MYFNELIHGLKKKKIRYKLLKQKRFKVNFNSEIRIFILILETFTNFK